MNKYRTMILSLLIVTLLCILYNIWYAKPEEVKKFEETFQIELPKDTEILFSEDTHGAFGEGETLVILDIGATGIETIGKYVRQNNWASLPLPENIRKRVFVELRANFGEKDAINLLNKSMETMAGYYSIENRNLRDLDGVDRETFWESYQINVTLAMLDIENSLIYYVVLDR